MNRLLQVMLQHETDVVLARQRTRRLTELLGFDNQDQTRITTAVSEIARNAYEYGGGGKIEFLLIGRTAPQLLEIIVSDTGPGIANLEAVLDGSQVSQTGMGIGITGARRLMDQFTLESKLGAGTTVRMRKFLPAHQPLIEATMLPKLMEQLATVETFDPLFEVRRQNQELLLSLDQVSSQRTELERLNQELEDTNRGVMALYAELHDRADHLRQADELKSRFLSDMSHEFRTPLNSIVALSRLLLDRVDGPLSLDQEKQVRFIRRAAENLTELVNDLLDLAKVEAGKIDIRPTEFTLYSLFGALRGMLRPLLVGERVALIFDEVEHLPQLYSDESKVSQILRNFISNALKFTERGEVRVSASLTADKQGMVLSVADTGMGIAPEFLDSIFEEFFQIDNPAQRRHKGTGLGLPLSRKLATLLNGSITVSSTVDVGSTFTLYLPLVYEPPQLSQDVLATNFVPQEFGIPVLAVEDDLADMYVYQSALANSMFSLVPARTTAEARGIIERAPPAAILLDLILSGETSWKLLASLKQDAATNAIPIIVVSTFDDEQKAMTLGADAYLHKPVTAEALLEVLMRVVNVNRTKVLVVEDDESFRYIVRQLLPSASYEVIEAATGIEGLRLAQTVQPDMMLLDINLPGMDGPQLLAQLALEEHTRDIPAIVITAAVEEKSQPVMSRVDAIIAKRDLSADVLMGAITDSLRKRRLAS
ncbi:MAG: ATP-binding protein [Steroidobacteraceae bacterium]